MKRVRALALVFVLALQVMAALSSAAARPSVTVLFNGHPISFDVKPTISGDRVLVPFRALFEAMGARVERDDESGTVIATRGDTTVRLVVNDHTAQVNGRSVTLDGAPSIERDHVMVPLGFISEHLGTQVTWDAETRTANVIDDQYPRRGGTVQLAMWSQPAGKFNPIIQGNAYDANILSLLFDGLWYLDDALRPVPGLAESWELSDDGQTVTFHLRRNVKWHDGQPFTAEDVRYTFEAVMHPDYQGPYNSGFDSLEGYGDFHAGRSARLPGIEVPDPYTVRFRLVQTDAPFFLNTGLPIVPKHLYEQVPLRDWGTSKDPYTARPIGTGPFKAAEFVAGQHYVFDAYDDYHLGRPYLDHVIWKVREQQVGLLELERGELDAVDIQPTDITTAQDLSGVHMVEFPSMGYQYIGFNTTAAPFDDRRLRQAVGWAIDRKALIEQLTQGHAGPIFSPVHPLFPAYTSEYGSFGYNDAGDQRLAQARKLLDEAGWVPGTDGVRVKNGQRLQVELLYPQGNKVRERSAPIIAKWLQDVGFGVKTTVLEFSSLADRVMAEQPDFQLFLLGWTLAPDPDPRGIFSKEQIGPDRYNMYRWYTDLSEELMEQGVRTSDEAARAGIYAKWQAHFAEEVPLIPLYSMNTLFGVSDRLHNFRPHPLSDYSLWNPWEWWVDP